MVKIKIKKELFPLRCDLCHKNDQFNRFKNECSRCKDVRIYEMKTNTNYYENNIRNYTLFLSLVMHCLIVYFLLGVELIYLLSLFVKPVYGYAGDDCLGCYEDKTNYLLILTYIMIGVYTVIYSFGFEDNKNNTKLHRFIYKLSKICFSGGLFNTLLNIALLVIAICNKKPI